MGVGVPRVIGHVSSRSVQPITIQLNYNSLADRAREHKEGNTLVGLFMRLSRQMHAGARQLLQLLSDLIVIISCFCE